MRQPQYLVRQTTLVLVQSAVVQNRQEKYETAPVTRPPDCMNNVIWCWSTWQQRRTAFKYTTAVQRVFLFNSSTSNIFFRLATNASNVSIDNIINNKENNDNCLLYRSSNK